MHQKYVGRPVMMIAKFLAVGIYRSSIEASVCRIVLGSYTDPACGICSKTTTSGKK